MRTRSYRELRRLKTFKERYNYLQLSGIVGAQTFGFDRYLNQIFYKSDRWRTTRDTVIIRDNGCDLGVKDYDINDTIYVHHMNPVTIEDLENDEYWLYDPNYLVSTSFNTHTAIHYGDESLLPELPRERTRNDTCPWL